MSEANKDKLSEKKCLPCEGGIAPLTRKQCEEYLATLRGWAIAEDCKSIRIQYILENFISVIDLTNRIAAIAETENHHPDIHLTQYRRIEIVLSTHAIGGLSLNDFILASKIDELPKKTKVG